MFRKRRRRRASSDGEGEGGSQRVQLACFWCRSKRVRCSGTKPVCEVSRSSPQGYNWSGWDWISGVWALIVGM